ncbi:hypothetical protein IFM89_037188 [Coptis chinensis]|uniref:Uncharacterized protein n=1 Tax=Coptis chinensis TaxID=261450 RepID=A0A835HQJ1_9MAGN|nr:hypothetical protein IFM89_037188 [Coptis chinensis]
MKSENSHTVILHKLFTFADVFDIVLMSIGTIFAIGNGIGLPLLTIVFGELVDAFGETDSDHVLHAVSKVSLKYVWFAIAMGVAAFLHTPSRCYLIVLQFLGKLCLYKYYILSEDVYSLEYVYKIEGMSVLVVDQLWYVVTVDLLLAIENQLVQANNGYRIQHTPLYSCTTKTLARITLAEISTWMVTGERQAARIRGLYLKTILRQDITFFDMETTTGEVIGRMSGDIILIQDAMGEKVGRFIQLSATFMGGFAIALIKGWFLSLVMLTCIPPLVAAGILMTKFLSKMSKDGQIAYAEAGNVVEQTVGAIKTVGSHDFRVASFTGEKLATQSYNRSLRKAYTSITKQALASGFGVGAFILIVCSSYGLAVWCGAKLIINKSYSGGQVFNVIISIATGGITDLTEPLPEKANTTFPSFSFLGKMNSRNLDLALGQLPLCLNAFAAGQAAAYKMLEVIKREPLIDAYDKGGIVPEDITGDIELKGVCFSYPARPELQIFSGFSLHVPSSTTVALVGQSGSGKSTVINLLERFYDPQAGEILIDGICLKKLQLKWIREKIGLVSQEPILFTTTIKENILYGKKNATYDEIRMAVELSNASKFIDQLPNGLDTMVGERGTQLSGGQKQRIALARAILKNPKILLLDEATSALDAESERKVQDALVRIMSNRTTVVVAHRLSTIRNADVIAVVQQGKIVEQGTHAELIKHSSGTYSQLIRLQHAPQQSENAPSINSDNEDSILDVDIKISRRASQRSSFSGSGSQRSATGRSRSRNSSSGRHSSFAFGLPGDIGNHETQIRAEDIIEGDENIEGTQHKVSVGRLAYMNRPELPVLLVGSIAAVVHGALPPVFGILLSIAIKTFFESPHELRKDSRFWSLAFVGLGGIGLLFIPVQYYLFGVAGGKLINRIRSMCFEKVVYQESSWFDEPSNSSGSIGARLSTDAANLKGLVGDHLALWVQNLSTITAAVIIAFVANWRLAFVVLALLPLLGLQAYVQQKFLQGLDADTKVMYEEASQVANDAVTNIRTVASFNAEQKVMDLYQGKCEEPMKHGVRLGVISGSGFGFANFVLYSTIATIFYIGARLVEDKKATFNEVFKVFFALIISAMNISQANAMAEESNKAKDSAASIFKILDSKPKIDSGNDEGATLASVRGDIDFHHVCFKYPTRPNVQIFQDLCLSVPSGKTVALVGESGSGKSTVISLLERFYDPDSGHILLDGIELQQLQLRWLRRQMGLVSQEPVLFNETIRFNIMYGSLGGVSEEEIITASEAANAHSFISGLPNGYNTSVGERGVQLSGGQKQRIAIARAILKDPKILLLDEATSALDSESERLVQDALDEVMINRTTIVVAHRLSAIKGADTIAVVKNGLITENGSHEELMKIDEGAYASLVSLHMSASK